MPDLRVAQFCGHGVTVKDCRHGTRAKERDQISHEQGVTTWVGTYSTLNYNRPQTDRVDEDLRTPLGEGEGWIYREIRRGGGAGSAFISHQGAGCQQTLSAQLEKNMPE